MTVRPADESLAFGVTWRVARTLASVDTSKRISDSLFVFTAVLLSLAVYVGGLGFNSDDWAFLGRLSTLPDQHNFVALSQNLLAHEGFRPRPLEAMYDASLYGLFGLAPTGYHLVNGAVLALGAVLLYLVLRELGLARGLAVSTAVVYAFLPNYSADRFWISASIAPLSVALYLFSLLLDVRLVSGRAALRWRCKVVSVVALLASGLAYELVIPFFPLSLLLMWWRGRKRAALLIAPNLAVLGAVVLYKLATSYRVTMNEGYVEHIWYLLSGSVRANYVTFVAGIPYLTWWGLRGGWSPYLALVATTIVVVVAAYVYVSLADDDLRRVKWLRLILCGVFVSVWGYAVFINNSNVIFTTTNVDNRTAIVATAGVALFLIGCAGWITSRVGKMAFSLSIAFLCLYGFLVINRLASFWQAAYQEDLNILYDIREQLPALPENTTLVLDGTCPEIGPAFVFRFNWDLTGALATLYHDPSLKGTVLTPDRKVDNTGLQVRTFRQWEVYPYGPNLLVYNARQKSVSALTDVDRARAYFDSVPPTRGCPPAFSWLG